ncbi:MAG: aromatic-ring-hydroxylating dioxygenase subunit beta [Oceanicaulis sp.]
MAVMDQAHAALGLDVDAGLEKQVTRFLTLEARLLDDRRFSDWVSLYAEDAVYWAPVDPSMQTPADGPSHFHDDIQIMKARVHRLENPRVFAPEPNPRTARLVGNPIIEALDETSGEIVAASTLMVIEYRERDRFEDDQRMFGGRVTHTLRPHEQTGFRIVRKRIDLINAASAFNAIAIPF